MILLMFKQSPIASKRGVIQPMNVSTLGSSCHDIAIIYITPSFASDWLQKNDWSVCPTITVPIVTPKAY